MSAIGPILFVLAVFVLFSWFWWGPLYRWLFDPRPSWIDDPTSEIYERTYSVKWQPPQEAMTFYTARCCTCSWEGSNVPLRRVESEIEWHARDTEHTSFHMTGTVYFDETQSDPQEWTPPATHH